MDATHWTVEQETNRVLDRMKELDIESSEYSTAVKNYRDLVETKRKERFTVSPDVIVMAVTNILGILLIMNHENLNVISTKAFGLIKRT